MLRCFSTITRKHSTLSNLPKSTDIVIVGGGVIGLSTAYHLTKLGCNNLLVLERNRITSGTTWHSNGLVWRLRPSDIDIQLLTRTQRLVSKELLEHENVESTGWINNGGLFLAHNQERIREYQRIHGLAKYFGIDSSMLDKNQVLEILHPLVEKDSNLLGGLFSPGDGYVDPTMYSNALVKAGKFKVVEDCQVTGITTTPLTGSSHSCKVHAVRVLKDGCEEEIKTDVIVNSTGVWAPDIAKLAGIRDVPQETFEHAYLITQPINCVSPTKTPNIRDHDLSIAFRVSGQTFQISYYEEDPLIISGTEKTLSPFAQFDFNWERAEQNVVNSSKLMPIIDKVGIKSTICGPESFTPDHKPLLGEDVDVRGFYFASGFNSFGICMSGGCGYQLSKIIVAGKADIDMSTYDIRRYNKKVSRKTIWSQARCRESYAKNYSIVYPQDEPTCARDQLLTDPLHQTLLEHGCVFQERHGKLRPGWFDLQKNQLSFDEYIQFNNSFVLNTSNRMWKAIKNELLACKQTSVIFNLSSMAKFLIEGPNAFKIMQWLVPVNLASLKDEGALRTYFLNKNGGIVSEVNIYKLNDQAFYLFCGDSSTHIHSHISIQIDKMFVGHVTDLTDEVGVLSVHGPKSKKLIEQSLGICLNQIDNQQHQSFKNNVRVARNLLLGIEGWDIHVNLDNLKSTYDAMTSSGEDVINGGWKTFESLALSAGQLSWGLELREDDLPLVEHETEFDSINLLKAEICPNKLKNGEFLGAERLNSLKADSTSDSFKKIFVLLQLADKEVLPQGQEPIFYQDKIIGMTRTGTFNFILDRPLTIGFFNLDQITGLDLSHLQVQIDINGVLRKAAVSLIA